MNMSLEGLADDVVTDILDNNLDKGIRMLQLLKKYPRTRVIDFKNKYVHLKFNWLDHVNEDGDPERDSLFAALLNVDKEEREAFCAHVIWGIFDERMEELLDEAFGNHSTGRSEVHVHNHCESSC